jgi:hypothetical protein
VGAAGREEGEASGAGSCAQKTAISGCSAVSRRSRSWLAARYRQLVVTADVARERQAAQ